MAVFVSVKTVRVSPWGRRPGQAGHQDAVASFQQWHCVCEGQAGIS